MILWWLVGCTALVLLALIGLLVRVRLLATQDGSFECALRRAGEKEWTSGVAYFGDDAVLWYRLVSLSIRPKRQLPREELEIQELRRRGTGGRVVDLSCRVGEEELELAMHEESFSALVAWIESAAPTQPRLF